MPIRNETVENESNEQKRKFLLLGSYHHNQNLC